MLPPHQLTYATIERPPDRWPLVAVPACGLTVLTICYLFHTGGPAVDNIAIPVSLALIAPSCVLAGVTIGVTARTSRRLDRLILWTGIGLCLLSVPWLFLLYERFMNMMNT